MEQLGQVKMFNASSFLDWFWNAKVLSEKPKSNGFYSWNNWPKATNETWINLDYYELIGTHSILLYINDNNVTYLNVT